MHERAFVLIPLADIAPNMMLDGKTIQKWTELIDASGIERTHEKLELNAYKNNLSLQNQ